MTTIAETFDDQWIETDGPLETPCWIWQRGMHINGYGQIAINGFKTTAHRFSWFRTNGLIPENLCVLHRCDVRACVNPSHLFLGTHKENTKDMLDKGRLVVGKRYTGEQNHKAKLTESQVKNIRKKFSSGASMRSLSRDYGVSRPAIKAVCYRKTWKHVE